MGMNVIVNESSDARWIGALLLVMGVLSAFVLRWAKRQGWW
jgi:Mg2+ and Co2+ transporter CorA